MADFDAIVIGSGMSGGWSAKELAERGLKVLVLERGKEIDPARDYKDLAAPWERPNLDRVPEEEIEKHYYQQIKGVPHPRNAAGNQYWVRDDEHPYEKAEGTDFHWLRGYHTGGRSVTWGRQSYRLSPMDFEANAKDGHGVDWPVRYEDIAPWYDHVEKFAGISGAKENLPQLPDGIFQPPFELTCPEKHLKSSVADKFPGRNVINARVAHLTDPTEEQMELGRGPCQVRNQCAQGCSFKAYFSSLHATLPAAMNTNNCTIKNDAIVESLEYDPKEKRISAVNVIDQNTKQKSRYTAKVIFLNASTIGSTMIMLQSQSEAFPNGLANSSGQLGLNLMDHVSGPPISGVLHDFENKTVYGRRPGGIYIPRYANVTENDKPYIRGFGFQGGSNPLSHGFMNGAGIGESFKEGHKAQSAWHIGLYSFGEVLPNASNKMYLHPTKKDKWGLPIAVFDAKMGENERIMMEEARKDGIAMLEAAGCTSISAPEVELTPMGNRIHEMGTARMGRDPKTSVLNGWCQAHDIPNLFVTDGSFMTSAGCQNPSLTYMAFSARAANYAADLIQAGQL
ncbi:GMC oxidoreductase [Hirschia litorea]|uniref:GMC oxidoreductase n=1 Tax=Hirschia litorea TaxID=1199156 RepID=A0ABW2IPC6_9PROT